jgi:16S rRNA (uracil1498-N3)-methyltransferase
VNELTEPGGKVRLFVEAPLGPGVRVTPSADQAHYLLHVMRAKTGERVSLFNGHDGEWRAEITEVTKRSCTFICETQTASQTQAPDLWLVFAPVKKTPSDYLAQKATELGVRVLQPVFTRRTIVTRVNLERLRANAIEAAEQSDRTDVPETCEPLPLEKLLAKWPAERKLLFCDEAGDAPSIADALNSSRNEPWAILTGPEGGFDPKERELIRAVPSVVPVTLGNRILRADTAALAALAVWQSLAGDWR